MITFWAIVICVYGPILVLFIFANKARADLQQLKKDLDNHKALHSMRVMSYENKRGTT